MKSSTIADIAIKLLKIGVPVTIVSAVVIFAVRVSERKIRAAIEEANKNNPSPEKLREGSLIYVNGKWYEEIR